MIQHEQFQVENMKLSFLKYKKIVSEPLTPEICGMIIYDQFLLLQIRTDSAKITLTAYNWRAE